MTLGLNELVDNLNLKKVKIRGDEIHASCPFPERHLHGQDKRPSFSINITKGVYNCFSCGSSGTIEDLISNTREISISAAISLLEEWGFSKLERELLEKEVEDERPTILPEGLLLYFDKMDDDFAEIYYGEVDEHDCLIFPVRNAEGKLVGAIARGKEEKWHKVLWNFHKSDYLYGENLIEKEQPIVITEGPGDVISLRKSGIKNAVALMGINISDRQVERLLSLSSEFIVWLDKDVSGAKGMKTILTKMENRSFVRFVDPWKHEEIEEKGDAKQVFEKYGPDKVKEIVSNAKTFLQHLIKETLI
jgi:DNA primase